MSAPAIVSAVAFVVVCIVAIYQIVSDRPSPGGVVRVYRGTAAEFEAAQTVVPDGALAEETDTGRRKVGAGVPWGQLPYLEDRHARD